MKLNLKIQQPGRNIGTFSITVTSIITFTSVTAMHTFIRVVRQRKLVELYDPITSKKNPST